VFLAGMAMDYTSAELKKAQLDAAADAAAIAAVTPAMMAKTDAQATTAAQNIFNSKASGMTGLNYSTNNLNVVVTDSGLNRTVTVSYTATSQNAFGNILHQSAWPINGSAQASSSVLPNIDFYLLLDNSPPIPAADRPYLAELRLARTLFCGPDEPGYFGCHAGFVSESGRNCTSDKIGSLGRAFMRNPTSS
jgi:hypothetical protein